MWFHDPLKEENVAAHRRVWAGVPNERLTNRHDSGKGAGPYVKGTLLVVRVAPPGSPAVISPIPAGPPGTPTSPVAPTPPAAGTSRASWSALSYA